MINPPLSRIGFITIGCRANQADTSRMESLLSRMAIVCDPWSEDCDVIIVNSCAVTSRAEADARKLIRRAKRRYPDAEIIVTGCAVQINPEKWSSIPEVGRIIGIIDRDRIDQILGGDDSRVGSLVGLPSGGVLGPTPLACDRSRPFLKIQDGCSRGCSYCIVPMARGPERSRPPNLIAEDIHLLSDSGFREIVLTGVHLGRWGTDIGLNLDNLIDLLENIKTEARIRFSSLEPMDLTPGIMEKLMSNPKICPHFHIPLQSGDDEILALMKRGHELGDYENLLRAIHKLNPDVSIGTDLIVGFPSETDATHSNTMKFLADLPLSYLHIFKYSPREGTPASKMPGRPYGPDVHRRMQELKAMDMAFRRAFRISQAGKVRECLIEIPETPQSPLVALSDNYIRIRVDDSGLIDRIGNLIHLVIDSNYGYE